MAQRFIPRTRKCDHCGAIVQRKASAFSRGTQGPLAGLVFCDRECQKARFRGHAKCCWPNCGAERLVESGNFNRKLTKSYFCNGHAAIVSREHGPFHLTSKMAVFLAGGEMPRHAATNSGFLRVVIWEMAGRKCAKCWCDLTAGRPASFHVDHMTPVWRGGITALSNLACLCVACHKIKSADEQREVNAARRYQPATLPGDSLAKYQRSMTHHEKDRLIAELSVRNRELQRELSEKSAETAPSI